MRNSFCGTPHIPFKVYFTIYIPAFNINQMWQRSLSSPIKDARISWSSELRRGLEKKAKGTWSWSEGSGHNYNLRSIVNSISVVLRKWISVGMQRAWPGDTHRIHQGQQHCCPKPRARGIAGKPPGLSCSFSRKRKPRPTFWFPAATGLKRFCWYQSTETKLVPPAKSQVSALLTEHWEKPSVAFPAFNYS